MSRTNLPPQNERGGRSTFWLFLLPVVISLGLTILVNAFLVLWAQRGEGSFHPTPEIFNPFKTGGIFFFFCFAFPIGLFPAFSRLLGSKNTNLGLLIAIFIITLVIIVFGFFWMMMGV